MIAAGYSCGTGLAVGVWRAMMRANDVQKLDANMARVMNLTYQRAHAQCRAATGSPPTRVDEEWDGATYTAYAIHGGRRFAASAHVPRWSPNIQKVWVGNRLVP